MHEIAPSSQFENYSIFIAKHKAIHSYDEQAFGNMSEESENSNFIIK